MLREPSFGIFERLSTIVEAIKENVCMVVARIDPRISNANAQDIIAQASSLHAMSIIRKGTGFLIRSGHIVTAYHVIENAYQIECLNPQNEIIELEPIKYNKLHDIALLRPKHRWSEGLNIASIPQFKRGDPVFTLGYPLAYNGPEPILSVGFLSSVQEEGNVRKLVVNAAFNPGNSGGPLLNLRGELLGIVVAKSIAIEPMMSVALRILEHPTIELVYGVVKLPGGIREEMTLSKIIRTLVKWIAENIQTNIGEAISVEHLLDLIKT